MRVALVNPNWTFEGSIYFGCREPHLPLEYGYARALLDRAGHQAHIVDGQMQNMTMSAICEQVGAICPDVTVITTAPSYLFWRCAPPELRVPQELARGLRELDGILVGIGPHASTTPRSTLRKLDLDVVVLGECEEILVRLAQTPRERWAEVPSIAYGKGSEFRVQGQPHAGDLQTLPSLGWEEATIERHAHHHHRFDATPVGRGAEIEASRGCPFHCTFCAKENFRDRYRKRPLGTVMQELDALIAQGVRYVYFVDEIFLPDRSLLEELKRRDVLFGVQMRIDQWSFEMLDLLGSAGCVSIEAGVESITPEGRMSLAKRCKLSTGEISALLVHARESVPFVQANLLDSKADHPDDVRVWREHLLEHGVWANLPVPLFPYPGSPEYTRRWGPPDDAAWERAHSYYLSIFDQFSDFQEARPLPLPELESPCSVSCRGGHRADSVHD
jgi:B12-binding domain/radical SAM domain protein of rhizo-twelve system